MKKTILILLVLLLSGCASIKKIEPGPLTVGERLSIDIEGFWNYVDFPLMAQPAQMWTMEGITIDQLLIYADIKDGQAMHYTNIATKEHEKFVFRSSMQTEAVISMFEGVLTRDGSTFKLVRMEPFTFGGKKGFRFDYEMIRKADNVQLRGVGFGAVDDGRLFAMIYQAPRLTFFPRHLARVEAMARTSAILQ